MIIIVCLLFKKSALRSVFVCRPLQVSQGNVPGVESASLAMDTEEGVEVVWNEVLFHDKKVFKTVEVSMGTCLIFFIFHKFVFM